MLSETLSWICMIGAIWYAAAHTFFLHWGKTKLYIDSKKKVTHIVVVLLIFGLGIAANKLRSSTNKGPISIEKKEIPPLTPLFVSPIIIDSFRSV